VKIRTAAFVAALAVVGVPAGALAAKPATHPTHPTTPASTNAAKPTVTFVLRGTLTAYTAVNGTTNGSVSLTVSGSNHVAKSLVKQPPLALTFAIAPGTRVQLHSGATIAPGDRAIVKVRATKASVASLQSASSISQLVDQGKVA
jgi:hypothetical protein